MPESVGWYIDMPFTWYGEESVPQDRPELPAEAQRFMPTKISGNDILVVDDDPYLCEIMTDVLEAEGHRIRLASNGMQALERIRERKPQLVLLDLMMPVMNGWEVAAAMRANPDWADIPIILITAAHGSDAQKQQETGARAVIKKPFDIDELGRVVEANVPKSSTLINDARCVISCHASIPSKNTIRDIGPFCPGVFAFL